MLPCEGPDSEAGSSGNGGGDGAAAPAARGPGQLEGPPAIRFPELLEAFVQVQERHAAAHQERSLRCSAGEPTLPPTTSRAPQLSSASVVSAGYALWLGYLMHGRQAQQAPAGCNTHLMMFCEVDGTTAVPFHQAARTFPDLGTPSGAPQRSQLALRNQGRGRDDSIASCR